MHLNKSFLINVLRNLSLFFIVGMLMILFVSFVISNELISSYIKSFHKNIIFTAEVGADNKLPFLETLVTKIILIIILSQLYPFSNTSKKLKSFFEGGRDSVV